jgi:hypothetical protein
VQYHQFVFVIGVWKREKEKKKTKTKCIRWTKQSNYLLVDANDVAVDGNPDVRPRVHHRLHRRARQRQTRAEIELLPRVRLQSEINDQCEHHERGPYPRVPEDDGDRVARTEPHQILSWKQHLSVCVSSEIPLSVLIIFGTTITIGKKEEAKKKKFDIEDLHE